MTRARTVTEKFSAPNDIWGGNLFKIFAEQVGNPARVAKLLHVTEQTVKRWMGDNSKVPRAAVLALYWETQYGRSQMHTDLLNEMQSLRIHIKAVEGQFKKAKTIVDGLRRLHTGSANEGYFDELAEISGCLPDKHGPLKPLPTGREHQEMLPVKIQPERSGNAWIRRTGELAARPYYR